jgi:hypothetical protein
MSVARPSHLMFFGYLHLLLHSVLKDVLEGRSRLVLLSLFS